MKLTFLGLLGILLISSITRAQAPTDAIDLHTCNEQMPLPTGSIQFQVLKTDKGCDAMLSPADSSLPAVRRYSFSERGIIQIFNEYTSKKNGSRTFFVFPRHQAPTITVVNDQEVDVVTSAGDLISFYSGANPPKIMTDSLAFFQLIENSLISENNSGGVEIVRSPESQTLVLDTGFQMGGVAFTHPDRSSVFQDAAGNKCTLLNKKLFTFANYDADLKFATDDELYTFLKINCPKLNLLNEN
jgi:hypothetical protein